MDDAVRYVFGYAGMQNTVWNLAFERVRYH